MAMANDNGPGQACGPYGDQIVAMTAAIYSAYTVTALMHTPDDWQRFYDREGGPLPFARKQFAKMNTDPEVGESAINLFLSTFLAKHIAAGAPRVHRKGMPLIGRALYGFSND